MVTHPWYSSNLACVCDARWRAKVKRRNGRKYYPPSQYAPAEVGPDDEPVPQMLEDTEEDRKRREEDEAREEQERRVSPRSLRRRCSGKP